MHDPKHHQSPSPLNRYEDAGVPAGVERISLSGHFDVVAWHFRIPGG